MMIITHDIRGFLITVREPELGSFAVVARDYPELQRAIEHYYGGLPHHAGDGCPICVLSRTEHDPPRRGGLYLADTSPHTTEIDPMSHQPSDPSCLCHAVRGFLATPIEGVSVRVVHCPKHAAADNLLAACKALLDAYAPHADDTVEHEGEGALQSSVALARDAIAQAEGRA